MTLEIGTVVRRGKITGLVTSMKGAPGGGTSYAFTTISILPQMVWCSADELEVLDPLPDIPVGSTVRYAGQDCEVLGHDAETGRYHLYAEIVLPSSGIIARHHYPDALRHHIAFWDIKR
ncbi:MAG: hypothetical protein EOS85_11560 [Mesorhizobium sp.]|nr:MAG: hypothetical protein EOS85_11560 [Mesorhizobium sp.]